MGGLEGGFSGGSGSYGDSVGPATTGAVGFQFGNIVSGGSGGFNPFSKGGAVSDLLQPQTMAIIAVAVLGVVYLFKK